MSDTEDRPRRKRGKGVPREELDVRYPSLRTLLGPSAGERAWVATFRARPDAMHALLADFIKQVHATPGRIGQRPMPREEQVDFRALLFGEEAEESMVVELPRLMRSRGISERALASKIHMSRTQTQRLLQGDYKPDVNEMRYIAAAVGKPPVFFLEYRKAMALAAFASLLDVRPGFATSLYRTYIDVNMGETT